MSLSQLRNVNFGPKKANATGSTGVAFTLLDTTGVLVSPRTTTGVYQLTSGSGIYAAYVTLPDGFHGQVLWDTGTALTPVTYAVDEENVESNSPLIAANNLMLQSLTGSMKTLYDMAYGRWMVDPSVNQMVFFGADNSTEIARFNLFDDQGIPSSDAVFQRQKV